MQQVFSQGNQRKETQGDRLSSLLLASCRTAAATAAHRSRAAQTDQPELPWTQSKLSSCSRIYFCSLFCLLLFFFRQPWNYILPWGIKLPGPLALHQLAYSMAPRASILNVVPLSTASCMGLNVWRKIVKRVLCSSWLPRGLDLGWLSFVSSILMTCFRQTFGNAFLAGKTYFLEEISFHIAKWIGKRGPLYGKGGKLCTGYKTQSKLDLLDYRKKAGQKWSKERQGTILKKYPGFPQWENVHAMEPTELPMPSGYLQQFWSRVSLNHRVTAVLPHSSPTCKTWISTQVRSSLY